MIVVVVVLIWGLISFSFKYKHALYVIRTSGYSGKRVQKEVLNVDLSGVYCKSLRYRFRNCICVILKTMRMDDSFRDLGRAQGEND